MEERRFDELRREVEGALRRAVDPGQLLPHLHRLAKLTREGSDENVFAYIHLAELVVERDPWRAALFAKRVIRHRPREDRAWAVLGFAQTLLGHYRSAAAAYRKALEAAPKNAWYAHNLGHILDVGINAPDAATPWLRAAQKAQPENPEFAMSLAHALGRAGHTEEAKRLLARWVDEGAREHAALWDWISRGAEPGTFTLEAPRPVPAPRRTRQGQKAPVEELESSLRHGLSRLPLDDNQRDRASALARDVHARLKAVSRNSTNSLAAAIAYAIVFIDEVPLTQAEVAAPFRVGVSSLRGRFARLRAELALTPRDARYATR